MAIFENTVNSRIHCVMVMANLKREENLVKKLFLLADPNMITGRLESVEEIKKGVWINLVNPSDSEIKRVCTEINIKEDFIRYPLDYEEQARIDTEDDMTLLVINIPIIEDIKDHTNIYNNATWCNYCKRRFSNNSIIKKTEL